MRLPVRTTCPYCGVGCGIVANADGTLAGDPQHPANRGRLCSKGAGLGETLDDADRLLQPEIRGRKAGWDEALDRVAETVSRTIIRHGPDAVGFYVSGQLLTEDYYVANKLMKGFIGSANIDTNSRLCMASSVAGHIRAFGEDIVPGCYDDIDVADLVVVVGSNMAWCHPVLYQRLAAAKAARGSRIVVIDPRRTATCEIADLHLAPRAGTDVVVFAGLLAHLAASGACDKAPAQPLAAGFDEAVEAAREAAPSLAETASVAGLAPADLARFYAWFATTERTVTVFSQGVNQSSAGTDKVNAIINCHLATGRIGRPGMGPLSLTGQPNAMGGREVGGLASQLAAHMGFGAADIDRVQRFWDAPRLATRPGLKAIDLFDAALTGNVKALWIIGTNPADSMPRAARVRAALQACPFIVVSDCWPTDTTRLADIVLPAAAWGEKDGTVTNSERRISRQRPFRPPPGAARPDWWMLTEIARRMGWGQAFRYRGPADIFREHAALSAFENAGRRVFDIGALAQLSDAGYDQLQPVQWPVCIADGPKEARFRGRQRVPVDTAKARFVATAYRPPAQAADEAWPLTLNTGRVRDQWHTMTRTGAVPRLMAHCSEPFLDIHPADAGRLGVADGGLVRVESRFGTVVLRARLSHGQRLGEVFVPMHWTDRYCSAGPVGRIVGAAADPVSGQPELKATPVKVTAIATLWRGVLVRRAAPAPPGMPCYWVRIPVAGGQLFELAGSEPLPSGRSGEAWISEVLGASPAAELVIYADARRGAFRYASIVGDRLEACLFIAREPAGLPAREVSIAALGRRVAAEARLALLAGHDSAGSPDGEAGRTVCTCFGVGLRTLYRAIVERRLASVADIGSALQAGTNCGSCVPELAGALRHVKAGTAL